MLIQVGELCTKPDMEKETLFLEPADLDDLSENKLLNLSKPTENE
jgi:hypothetical protein